MPATEMAAKASRPWYVKIAMTACGLLLLPAIVPVVAILLGVWLISAIHNFVSETCFYVRMRQRGRILRRRDLSSRIDTHGSGTFIVESPSLGWGFTHAWWTPEKVLAICPYPSPSDADGRRSAENMRRLDWDQWHWDNYTDPNRGRALLLRVWNGRSLERWMKRTFPEVDVVDTWTALVCVPKPAAQPGEA